MVGCRTGVLGFMPPQYYRANARSNVSNSSSFQNPSLQYFFALALHRCYALPVALAIKGPC